MEEAAPAFFHNQIASYLCSSFFSYYYYLKLKNSFIHSYVNNLGTKYPHFITDIPGKLLDTPGVP